MASTGIKEYTLKINGVAQNITNVTKLEDAVNSLNATMAKVDKIDAKVNVTTKTLNKTLTEEEKALKKLADTEKKIADVTSKTNAAQIEANIALRERTREITRQIQISSLAEGSISEMGMSLTNLKNIYEDLSAAERNDVEVGVKLLEQIQALDAEYKALRESTGNFRDSVGNYEKALSGITKVKEGFEKAGKGAASFSADVLGSSDALSVITTTTDTLAASTERIATIVELAGQAQEVYNQVTKEGIIQEKAAAVMDGIRAIQLKAKTAAEALSTKGTIAATIAQGVFNLVAAANPYVLLALALIAVVGALFLFSSNTDKSAEAQKRLNAEQLAFLEYLDSEAARLKLVSEARQNALENQIKILNAQGAKTNEIRKVEDALYKERRLNNARLQGIYAEELYSLEANRAKLQQYYEMLVAVKNAQARGDNKVLLDIDLNGRAEKVKVEEAVDIVQGKIDLLNKKVQIAVDLKTEQANIRAELEITKAERIKADKEEAKRVKEENKRKTDEADKLAKERGQLEKDALQAQEDARIKLIAHGYEKAKAMLRAQYAKEIEDIRFKLATEKKLTEKAKIALNATIVDLQKLLNKDLDALAKERAAQELETVRELEDMRTAYILGQADRARAEINNAADRQVEDLQKRLATELALTQTQQEAITEQILFANEKRARDLQKLEADQQAKRTSQELAGIDIALTQAQNKIGEFTVRNKTGLKLIDVDATKKNLAAANAALSEYISGLTGYQKDLAASHKATLATMQEGTTEYTDELQKYALANEDVTQRIKKAQKEQIENTKESTKVQTQYLGDVIGKIGEFASTISDAIGGVLEGFNAGLQVQLDGLNESLEEVNEQYEAAQTKREDAAKNVEDIESQIQAASANTSSALQEQLADATKARNDAAREEQRLLKEKEKREAEIRKKERQIKRNELISNIAQAIANTAQAVTKALTLVFPLNLVVAGLVGIAGGLQIASMTKQLSKLEKGGPIIGPSHAEGGVPIGLGYEAEGGEFVINRKSYGANAALVEFINSQPDAVTMADLLGIVPNDNATLLSSDVSASGDDKLLAAIEAIEFKPVVAVTDIIDAQDQITTVQDLAGF